MPSFQTALLQELIANIYNCYGNENWDEGRFGKHRRNFAASVLGKINAVLSNLGIAVVIRGEPHREIEKLKVDIDAGLSFTHDLLEDAYSKEMFTKVMAYRILGHRKVKLPSNAPNYWQSRERALSLRKGNGTIPIEFCNWFLNLFELEAAGYPLKLYGVPLGIAETFILRHYVYDKTAPTIQAQEGDCVIDAGGCWGDTALFFAYEVGAAGKVYSFEFVPENLAVMEKNLQLNPELESRVEVIRNPLWSRSNMRLFLSVNGPASRVRNERSDESDLQVTTLSIDEFVASHNLSKVDFIKMDIEGAELEALKGAAETIQKHKPKLAISLYHKLDDFMTIPAYLSSLDAKYRYYLDHLTIHAEETVLFATPA